MKKNLSVVFLLLGTIIGAGFCSGKEICVYFAKFGFSSLFFLPMFFFIYYFLFKTFLNLGRAQDYPDFSAFNKKYGKSAFFDVVLLFTYVIFSSAMFACIGEMGDLYFGTTIKYIILAATFVFCVFMLKKNFDKLKLVNSILIPIVLVVIVLVCVLSLFNTEKTIMFTMIKNGWMLFFTPIIYACQGLTLSYYILIKAGHGIEKKSANTISIVSASILTLIMALAIVVFNLFPSVLSEPLPFVLLTFKLGFPFDLIYAPIMFFAILTTLLSSTRALYDYLSKYIQKPILRALVVCVVTLVLSFCGFDKIVESLYPLVGCMGLVIILKILFADKKSQKSEILSKNRFLDKEKLL